MALIASTGLLSSLSDQGRLIDVETILDPSISVEVDDYLLGLTINEDGGRYAIPWAVSVSSLVWYLLDDRFTPKTSQARV